MSFYKEAASRLIKEFWKLSPEARSATHAAGMHRSEQAYARGIARGNRFLKTDVNATIEKGPITAAVSSQRLSFGLKRYGSSLSFPKLTPVSRRMSAHYDNTRIFVKPAKNTLDTQSMIRHELFEGREAKNLIEKKHLPGTAGGTRAEIVAKSTGGFSNAVGKMFGKQAPSGAVSSHNNFGVLARESNLLQSIPYDTALRQRRFASGEAGKVSEIAGKQFGVDKINIGKFNKTKVNPSSVNTQNVSHKNWGGYKNTLEDIDNKLQ